MTDKHAAGGIEFTSLLIESPFVIAESTAAVAEAAAKQLLMLQCVQNASDVN